MKLIVICVVYPPINTSSAIQINHLVEELAQQGHNISVITPDSSLKKSYRKEINNKIEIIRFKNGKVIDTNLLIRALNELIMPFKIIYTIIRKKIKLDNYDGIIYWSPSIFFTPLIIYLKIINKCKSYLILRDIFPRWARDLKIIKKRIVYYYFNLFFILQCYFSDIIGVQSEGNRKFIPKTIFFRKLKIEVLNNWYKPEFNNKNCSIDIMKTKLKNKKIFIHAGNIGLAQGFEILINIAEKLQDKDEIGFLFIGRGSQFEIMKKTAIRKSIANVVFYDQIDNSEIVNLYKSCHYGIVILDKRHKTHNIPGKLLSYLHSGLPVFAIVNPENDIIDFIKKNNLGFVTDNYDSNHILRNIVEFANKYVLNSNQKNKYKKIAKRFFDTKKAAKQILSHF